MSGGDSCGRIFPSLNSTMECTTDSGVRITISNFFSGGRSKSQRASIRLEAFVEHRCRIDGDFVAHPPGGVIEGISEGGFFDLLHQRVAEGPA